MFLSFIFQLVYWIVNLFYHTFVISRVLFPSPFISWVEAWNSACLSRCPRGERPLVELYLEPGVFSERCTERLLLRVDCIHRLEFGEVSGHWVLIKRGPGNRGPTECGTTHEATAGTSPEIIPGLGRSPREGHGNLLQYSCLENPQGQRSLAGYSPWGCKESNTSV